MVTGVNKWPSPLIPRSYPYTINYDRNDPLQTQFSVNQSFLKKRWRNSFGILCVAVVVELFKLISERDSIVDTSVNVMIPWDHFLVATTIYKDHLNCSPFVQLLNQIISFEKRHKIRFDAKENEVSRKVRMILRILQIQLHACAVFCIVACTIAPTGLWGHLPKALFQVEWGGEDWIALPVVQKLGSFCYTYFIVTTIINHMVLDSCLVIIATTYCLLSTLIAFERSFHQMKNRSKGITMYREIQLLCAIYNELNKGGIIQAFILIPVVTLSVALTTSLGHFDQIDTVSFCAFMDAAGISLLWICTCFHFAMKIFARSEDILKKKLWSWNDSNPSENARNGSTKIWKADWRSMPVVKIFFFGNNFFEKSTQLVILDFVINNTVTLMLLT